MNPKETEKLIKRIREADEGEGPVEDLVKELIFGMALNLSRVAAALAPPR